MNFNTSSPYFTMADEDIASQTFPLDCSDESYTRDLKLEKFDGKSNSFSEWLAHFKLIATLKNYPPEVKPMLLLAALKGEPLALSASLTDEDTSSFSSCVRALKLRLGDTKTEKDFEISAQCRKRKSDESPQSFANSLQELFTKAFPSMENDSLQRLILTQFVRGSGHADLQFKYDTEKDLKLSDAIRYLTAYDKKSDTLVKGSADLKPLPSMISCNVAQTSKPTYSDERVMYANPPRTADTTSRRHFQADHHRNQSSICQICHKPGHEASSCFRFLAMQEQLHDLTLQDHSHGPATQRNNFDRTFECRPQRPHTDHPQNMYNRSMTSHRPHASEHTYNQPRQSNPANNPPSHLNAPRSQPGRNLRPFQNHRAPQPFNRFQNPR